MKNKKILSIFSTVLTLILLLSSIPLSPFVTFATEEAKASEAVKESLFEGLKEDPAMRDRFTKHYYDKNGTYYAVVYPEQIHYVEDGQWADVDNTLRYDLKTASYVNENPKFSFGFAANSESSNLVTISDGSYTLSWSVRMNSTADDRIKLSENELQSFEASINRSASAVISAAVSNKKATPEDLTSEIKAVSGIRYSGVLNNEVDLRYTAYHGKIEEDVILNEKGTFKSYTMTVNTDGLTATVADDSSVVFTNAEGKTVFTIAAPWMCDANGELSDDITVSITQIRNTAYITYTPSAEWLSDDNRAYPVLIDPSVTSRYYTNNYQDTYVASGDSTSYASQRYMFVGNKSSKNIKALIKIINMPEILGSANVEEAKFNFWLTDTSNPNLKISHANSAWNASTVTYANCPTGSQLDVSGRDGMDQSDVEIDPYEEEYVSYSRYSYNIIDWVNGSYTNNGFIIEYNTLTTGQNVRIWSSEHTEAKFRPTITFKYEFEQNECLESGAIYSFVSAKTEKRLTVENGIDANGTNLILQDDSMSPSQSFRLEYNDVNDSFKFRAVCSNDGTGKVVNISYDSTIDPTTGYTVSYVQLWDYTPSLPQNQEWLIIPVSNDRYKIVSAYDPRLALTLHGSSDVVVTTDTGSISQFWYIESGWVRMTENSINVKKHNNVGEANVGTNTTKLFYPVTLFGDSPSWSVDSNSVASITYEGVVNAITVGSVDLSLEIIDDYGHGRLYTIHFYSKLPNGVYTLQCQYSEGYLESPYGIVQDGTQYILWEDTTNNNSQFKVVYLGEGKYVLRSMVASNRAVAVDSQNRVVSQKIADYDTLADVPTNAQWIITDGSYGYELKNVATGLYLEGENGYTGYESLVTGDTYANNYYQCWNLEKINVISEGLSIVHFANYLVVGDTFTFTADMYSSTIGENGPVDITWSITSGTSYASIDSSTGKITAISQGMATVTATCTDESWNVSYPVDIIPLSPGVYFFKNKGTEKFMQPDDNGADHMEQHEFDASTRQRWYLIYDSDLYYQILNVNTGKYLTAPSNTNDKEAITEQPYSESTASRQLWKITKLSNGAYKIQAKARSSTSLVLAVGWGTNSNGINIEQMNYANDSNRKDEWIVVSKENYAHVTLPVKIYYDASALGFFTQNEIKDLYEEAAHRIFDRFNIKFEVDSIECSAVLNLDSDCKYYGTYEICNNVCGNSNNCLENHHKNVERVWNLLRSDTSEYYVCRLVGYTLCNYVYDEKKEKMSHCEVGGYGTVSGVDSVASIYHDEGRINYKRVTILMNIQHELTHNLGATHHYEEGDDCIMNGNHTVWCESCAETIIDTARDIINNNSN